MPRVSYTTKHKVAGEVEKFPELKLRKAEQSRLWLPAEPWMEPYHRIEAPVIEDGEVVMEVKDTKRGPVEVPKMDWIASAFCLGVFGIPEDPGPMLVAGIDPDNCPVCESAANNTGVNKPELRYAAPVIKYKVKGRGQNPYELITPTTAEVLVWAYTARQHGMLHDLAAREEIDLRKLDITIDLEDTPGADTYQKIKALGVIRKPAWSDPKVKDYIRALWANEENRPTDEQLRVACKGRDYARPVLQDMVRRAERQWRDSERAGGSGGDLGAADAGFNGDLGEGIDALLGTGNGNGGGSELADGLDQAGLLTSQEKDDIFSDIEAAKTDPTAPGVTGTSTAAPAAESPSSTEPKSAPSASSSDALPDDERAAAVEAAADGLFGESSGDAAPPEPAKPAGRKPKAKAEEPKPEPVPETTSAPAGAGGVVDFDSLFS